MSAKEKETAQPDAGEPEAASEPDAAATPDSDALTVEFLDGDLPEDEGKSSRDTKYRRALAQLDEHPGKWARIVTAKNRNGARTMTYTNRKKYPDYEWAYRNTDVYARKPEAAGKK